MSSLSGWTQFVVGPETADTDTFEVVTDDLCYSANPCIRVRGIPPQTGISDVYIERAIDVSNYLFITVGLEINAWSLDTATEWGFVETVCDSDTPQRTEFNHGNDDGISSEDHYSNCLHLNVGQCSSLILRIGGRFSGAGDEIYVTQIILQYQTGSPTVNPTETPTLFPSVNPTPAPTVCVSSVDQTLNVNSFVGWDKFVVGPEIAEPNKTFAIETHERCYHTNPCIKLQGMPSSGSSAVYIERALDVSNYVFVTVGLEINAWSLDVVEEFGFVETVCDSDPPQTVEFHHGNNSDPASYAKHYSECLQLSVAGCDSLTLRIGGHFSGGGDDIYITQILLEYQTGSPSHYQTMNPSQIPTSYPTPAPTICFTGMGRLLNTRLLTEWNTIMTPEIAGSTTFEVVNDTVQCYAINPCIKLKGKGSSGVNILFFCD